MGELKKWLKQDWVRIGTDGEIKGPCGTSKDKKNPDRCLPRSKARSLSKKDRAATAKKKKKAGAPSPTANQAGCVTLTRLFGNATMFPVQSPASNNCITWLCLCCAGSSAISLSV